MPIAGVSARRRLGVVVGLLAGVGLASGADAILEEAVPTLVTNIAQLRQLASAQPVTHHIVRLNGDVWWTRHGEGRFVLADESGAAEIQAEWSGDRLRFGQRVRMEGSATIVRTGERFQLGGFGPIVDNDGEHSIIEKSGAVYLHQGLQPIRLEWFNQLGQSGLEVAFEGPGLARQRIPPSLLFKPVADPGRLEPGLAYLCYTGAWQRLPSFQDLTPVQTGGVKGFSLSVIPQPQHVAVVFEGQLRVVRAGLYQFHLQSDDGSRLFVGAPTLSVIVDGAGRTPEPRHLAVGQTWRAAASSVWGMLEGRVTRESKVDDRTLLELRSGAARVRLEVGDPVHDPTDSLVGRRVRATGVCQAAMTPDGDSVVGAVLVPDFSFLEHADVGPTRADSDIRSDRESGLTLLTEAVEVHRLKREQAQRGHPVRIRGVVTSVLPEHQAFTVQDATRGLYVEDHSSYRSRNPEVGEFLAVDGVTDPSLFAPIVQASMVRSLGSGLMPDPIKPTWDQLMNGSLDAQFVELEGIVTAVQTQEVSLLTRDGLIAVELRVPGLERSRLNAFENALVYIRGCLFASWDYVTHQVQFGRIRIYNASITVEQRPPDDLFDTSSKTIDELLQFDPQAGAFQRVRVSGQVVHVRGAEHFLMNGDRGLRFVLRKSARFGIGDIVEVVGFPELFGSASPVLREAVARRMGEGPLPTPSVLSLEEPVDAAHDSTLVRVEGLLAGSRRASSESILEIQNGVRTFAARLGDEAGSLPELPVGARLELSGVFASHGGVRAVDREISGFDLLINSPEEIRVLAKPPWWTLKRLLLLVALLACGLTVTMLWITQLRSQVEQRSAELATQIKRRERAEYERVIDQERARIAQDLHDELGSGITEISMLAARVKASRSSEQRRRRYLDEVGGKARDMVTSLDEIVWAMDPHHDSISSLISYCSLYADRFLGLAGIAWRLEGPRDAADRVVDSHQRHQVYVVLKEALNNVVRHSGATEVRLRVEVKPDRVCLEVIDNGRGMTPEHGTESMTGLAGMKRRMNKLGGECEIVSAPGQGTTVRMVLPSETSQ